MSLLERVEQAQAAAAARLGNVAQPLETARPVPPPVVTSAPQSYAPQSYTPLGQHRHDRESVLRDLRQQLQEEAVGILPTITNATTEEIRAKLDPLVTQVASLRDIALTREERQRLVDAVVDEIVGLGPLEPLLADTSITEIMVNGADHIYIERAGKIQRVPTRFMGDEHVRRIIDRIITPIGRRIDETSPRVDARLADGSRVNAIIAPLSLIGPVITIRKFAAKPYTVEDLIRFGTATPDMFEFLRACIEARLNLFVSGGTGSGKTTTLNVLSSFIPEDDRIVTIEDSAELQLHQKHVITLEARPANLEGEGEITIRDLLRNALHMRPDRIVVGECRSGEALDMLQAMTTGHSGSLSTGHANTPADMLRRLETMILMTGYELPLRAIREQIAGAVDLIVHTARLKDGTRKIVNITEVYGIEDGHVLLQDIFTFQQTGLVDGKIQGRLAPTGIRPTFMPKLYQAGVMLPPDEYGIPSEDPKHPDKTRSRKGSAGMDETSPETLAARLALGRGRVVVAAGMVYVSSVGPVDLDSGQVIRGGIKEQTRQCVANLKARLAEAGTSPDQVVWATWSLRDPMDFDEFSDEWAQLFPGDGALGHESPLPTAHRRAGFRVSMGVIARVASNRGGTRPSSRAARSPWPEKRQRRAANRRLRGRSAARPARGSELSARVSPPA